MQLLVGLITVLAFSMNLFAQAPFTVFEKSINEIQEALEKGKYTIALMKFENGTTTANIHNKLSAYVEQRLMGSDDPFLTIVDLSLIHI